MLADFYIPRLSNDMKIAVQKNNLVGQIWYRSLDPVKKTASWHGIRNTDNAQPIDFIRMKTVLDRHVQNVITPIFVKMDNAGITAGIDAQCPIRPK